MALVTTFSHQGTVESEVAAIVIGFVVVRLHQGTNLVVVGVDVVVVVVVVVIVV